MPDRTRMSRSASTTDYSDAFAANAWPCPLEQVRKGYWLNGRIRCKRLTLCQHEQVRKGD